MSKTKKWKKKSFKKTYSEKELLLAKLHKLLIGGMIEGKDQITARSLISWHLKMNGLSLNQWDFVDVIIKRAEQINKPPQMVEKQYLYGISDGEMIKLGMSNNIKKRIVTLQTSSPRELKIIWEYYTGRNAKVARALEKKLHRRCRKHHVRGEWFSINCLDLVTTFRGQEENKVSDMIDSDISILFEASKRF